MRDGAYPESAGVAQVISEDRATASLYVAPNMPADCAEHLHVHATSYHTTHQIDGDIRWSVDARAGQDGGRDGERGTGDWVRGTGRMLEGKTDSGAERSTRNRKEGEEWAMVTYVLAVPAL